MNVDILIRLKEMVFYHIFLYYSFDLELLKEINIIIDTLIMEMNGN